MGKERLERERENEERIQYLLQKENEIHQKEIEESSEEEAEEELKHNILQCLEDEVENLPTLKTVDIKAIQQQMQEQMKKPVEKKVEKDNDPVFSKNESHVNKFKGIFDNDTKEEGEAKPLGQKKKK